MDDESVSFIHCLKPKLWSFIELDVCGRPLFANPVTYKVWHIHKTCKGIDQAWQGKSLVEVK